MTSSHTLLVAGTGVVGRRWLERTRAAGCCQCTYLRDQQLHLQLFVVALRQEFPPRKVSTGSRNSDPSHCHCTGSQSRIVVASLADRYGRLVRLTSLVGLYGSFAIWLAQGRFFFLQKRPVAGFREARRASVTALEGSSLRLASRACSLTRLPFRVILRVSPLQLVGGRMCYS